MNTISRTSAEGIANTQAQRLVASTPKVSQELQAATETAGNTKVDISAEGKALFEQSLSDKVETVDASDARQPKAIRIDGTEDQTTLISKFRKMSAADKEVYIQQKVSRFDAYLEKKQYSLEIDPASGGADNTLSRESFESAVRKTVNLMAADPATLRGVDVSKDFANLRRATDSDLDLTQAASRAIVSDGPIAAGEPPAAPADNQPEIGSPTGDIHVAYSPNVLTSTINTAIKSLGVVESMIDSLKDGGEDMHGVVGQVMSDKTAY